MSLFFLLLAGCVSAPPPDLSRVLPEGHYMFDCPIVYENGLVKITHQGSRIHVQLLEDYTGSFYLEVSGENSLKIVDPAMDYPGLKRSFKGEGTLLSPGVAEGEATMWLKSVGPISRNHRDGPWVLRPADPEKTASFYRKQKSLEERKARAEKAMEEAP